MQSLKGLFLDIHQADQSGSLKYLEPIPEGKPSITPRNRDSKKTPTYCVKVSPRISVKRTTAAPPILSTLANLDRISTARDESIGSRSARKPATFRLTRPSTNMRVGAQSLKSLNFSSHKAKPDDSSDDDVVLEDEQNLSIAPLEEEPIISADEKPQHTAGKEGVGQFYKHFRQLDKINDINKFKHVKDTAYTSFLKKTEAMNLLPSKIGIVKERGSEDKLKIK